MSVIAFDSRVAVTYQLCLPSFEGPLDVLLRLIERQDLPITEVSLILVTQQFLEAAKDIGATRPASIAEFAAIGARLVALKSRSLLPRPPVVEEDEAAPEALVTQLIEYRSVKEAAASLALLDKTGRSAFAKGAGSVNLPSKPVDLPLANHEPRLLVRALGRRLTSTRGAARLVEIRPMISLRQMVDRLLDQISHGSRQFHQAVAAACTNSHEERALFLALLVLVRRGVVEAQQEEPFAEITLRRIDGGVAALHQDVEEF
jgi:segregation and condensation protein A